MRISAVILTFNFFFFFTPSIFPLCTVSSTILLVWVYLRLCMCFLRFREGWVWGEEKKGFQYPNQSDVSYSFRSFQMRSDHRVCAVFLSKWWPDRVKQLLWLKLPQGQGELSWYVWNGMLFVENWKPTFFNFRVYCNFSRVQYWHTNLSNLVQSMTAVVPRQHKQVKVFSWWPVFKYN